MSSSERNVGRNVGRNASYHVPLQEFFEQPTGHNAGGNNAGHNAAQAEERPNEQVTWTIRLNRIDIPDGELRQLSTELWNSHNMGLSQSNLDRDIITISGIPSNNDFREDMLMVVVRAYAPHAEIIHE